MQASPVLAQVPTGLVVLSNFLFSSLDVSGGLDEDGLGLLAPHVGLLVDSHLTDTPQCW